MKEGHSTDPMPGKADRSGQPEPRADESSAGLGSLLGWIIVITVAAAGGRAWMEHQAAIARAKASPSPAAAAHEVPVVAAAARKGDLPVYLDGLGTVIPFNTVTIRSRVDGHIQDIAFTEGATVKQGDLLAQIDPRPFQVQLAQAQGQMAKDSAQLANARLDLGRYKDVPHTVTAQQLATQQALINQLEGTRSSDQALVDNAKLQLTYSRIESPIDGRIGLKLVDLGNLVHANDPTGIAVITQLRPIAVVFNIPQDSIPSVTAALRNSKELTVEAYDRSLKHRLAVGALMALDNQVDPGTGTLRLKARFQNDDDALFPNQFVNARLLVDVRKAAVIIPSAGIQRGPDSTFAYVVGKDGAVEMRTVKAGPTEGDQTVVESGLSDGDVVVTDGADKLVAGMKVSAHLGQDPAGGKSRMASAAAPGGAPAREVAADPPSPGATAEAGDAAQGHGHRRKKSE